VPLVRVVTVAVRFVSATTDARLTLDAMRHHAAGSQVIPMGRRIRIFRGYFDKL
jgi:hypothetical protein